MNKTEIEIVSSSQTISKIIKEFNLEFPQPLDELVGDLDKYAKKLAQYAICAIVKKEGIILGYIIFYMNDKENKTGYITQIAIDKKYRGTGIGMKLIQYCIDTAIEKGFNTIRLEVDKKNESAIKLYEKMQFVYEKEASKNSDYMMREL